MEQVSNPLYTPGDPTTNNPIYPYAHERLERKRIAVMRSLVSNCTAFMTQLRQASKNRIIRDYQNTPPHSTEVLQQRLNTKIFELMRTFQNPPNTSIPDETHSSNPSLSPSDYRLQQLLRFYNVNSHLIIHQLSPNEKVALMAELNSNRVDERRFEEFTRNTLSLLKLFA